MISLVVVLAAHAVLDLGPRASADSSVASVADCDDEQPESQDAALLPAPRDGCGSGMSSSATGGGGSGSFSAVGELPSVAGVDEVPISFLREPPIRQYSFVFIDCLLDVPRAYGLRPLGHA
jgi:hypothetical protein